MPPALQQQQPMQVLPLDPIWVEAASKASQTFAYGDVIPHDWLLDSLAIRPLDFGTADQFKNHSFDMLQKIEGFKKVMLESHQMFLTSVRGEGYKIINPPQQTEVAMKSLQKDLQKSIKSAVSALTNINTSLLGLDDFKSNAEAKAKIAWLSQQSSKALTKN